MTVNYSPITELSGDLVSQEQIFRLCNRYYWAGEYCRGKDVLEAGCGAGQGLGYLAGIANSVEGGDYSEEILNIARKHYGDRIPLRQFDAQEMPFEDASKDVILLFEALYYIPSAEKFADECKRVLRPGGRVLISNANKDLFDFNPSPHSYVYHGVVELRDLFGSRGFSVECFGHTSTKAVSLRQKVLRPVKKLAVSFNLIPKTSSGKQFLKRIVFGKLHPLPAEVREGMAPYHPPTPISSDLPDQEHKVIFCTATLNP